MSIHNAQCCDSVLHTLCKTKSIQISQSNVDTVFIIMRVCDILKR